MALAVAVLGVTGCGGSDAPPPAAAPAPPATAAPSSGSTTPVSAGNSGAVGVDIAGEAKAARKAVRAWGKAASKVCRKSDKRFKSWDGRAVRLNRHSTRADAMRAGRVLAQFARAAEREYDLLTAIAMPKEADAVHAIDSFLQKHEEAMILLHRLGADFSSASDASSAINGLRRIRRIEDDHERAALTVNARVCGEVW
jgi:hypothetical protein